MSGHSAFLGVVRFLYANTNKYTIKRRNDKARKRAGGRC